MTDEEKKKPRPEKTLKQKIATLQQQLNHLKTKEREETKRQETRQKIILGAEVAKALGSHVYDVDKPFVMGLLLRAINLKDEEKALLRAEGERFLANLTGRQQ